MLEPVALLVGPSWFVLLAGALRSCSNEALHRIPILDPVALVVGLSRYDVTVTRTESS